jgi:hypothetical protein
MSLLLPENSIKMPFLKLCHPRHSYFCDELAKSQREFFDFVNLDNFSKNSKVTSCIDRAGDLPTGFFPGQGGHDHPQPVNSASDRTGFSAPECLIAPRQDGGDHES